MSLTLHQHAVMVEGRRVEVTTTAYMVRLGSPTRWICMVKAQDSLRSPTWKSGVLDHWPWRRQRILVVDLVQVARCAAVSTASTGVRRIRRDLFYSPRRATADRAEHHSRKSTVCAEVRKGEQTQVVASSSPLRSWSAVGTRVPNERCSSAGHPLHIGHRMANHQGGVFDGLAHDVPSPTAYHTPSPALVVSAVLQPMPDLCSSIHPYRSVARYAVVEQYRFHRPEDGIFVRSQRAVLDWLDGDRVRKRVWAGPLGHHL